MISYSSMPAAHNRYFMEPPVPAPRSMDGQLPTTAPPEYGGYPAHYPRQLNMRIPPMLTSAQMPSFSGSQASNGTSQMNVGHSMHQHPDAYHDAYARSANHMDYNSRMSKRYKSEPSPSSSPSASGSPPQMRTVQAVGPHSRTGLRPQRQRTAIACQYCRRRKIRCSGFDPSADASKCTNCARYHQDCVFTPVSSAAMQTISIPPSSQMMPNAGRPQFMSHPFSSSMQAAPIAPGQVVPLQYDPSFTTYSTDMPPSNLPPSPPLMAGPQPMGRQGPPRPQTSPILPLSHASRPQPPQLMPAAGMEQAPHYYSPQTPRYRSYLPAPYQPVAGGMPPPPPPHTPMAVNGGMAPAAPGAASTNGVASNGLSSTPSSASISSAHTTPVMASQAAPPRPATASPTTGSKDLNNDDDKTKDDRKRSGKLTISDLVE